MNYTLKVANGDYASLDLEKSGNKYLVLCYVYGYGITFKREFDNYEEANTYYLAKCEISHVTPVEVDHDPDELLTNVY